MVRSAQPDRRWVVLGSSAAVWDVANSGSGNSQVLGAICGRLESSILPEHDTLGPRALDTSSYVEKAFDLGAFFARSWRTQPLHVPGGAISFLGGTWSVEAFEDAHQAARGAGAVIHENAGEVVFIESVSRFDQWLSERARDYASVFGAATAWFDGVRTWNGGAQGAGIGAHFDHSDNFVLQQEGTKEWTLAPPRTIAAEDLARRMMNVPGVGAHDLPPEGTITFMVRPGDLLYIPLFWLHSGVSERDSLSLSLVCPARSLYAAVIPYLLRAMRERAIGHQVVPAQHSLLSEEQHAGIEANLRSATRVLLLKLADDGELLDAIAQMRKDASA